MSVNRSKRNFSAVNAVNAVNAVKDDDPSNALERERKKHNGKRYDKEFKVAAAKLVTEKRYTPKEAALSLGVKPSTLQYWIKIYGRRPGEQAETVETLRMKNKQLEAENQRLKLEREILKKLGWQSWLERR